MRVGWEEVREGVSVGRRNMWRGVGVGKEESKNRIESKRGRGRWKG